jgi:hypothetical protein
MIFIRSSILRRVLAAVIHSNDTLPAIPRRLWCILPLTAAILDEATPDVPARSN